MDDAHDTEDGGLSPEAAFALLANETRVATIEALWESWDEGPVPFSVLRNRVGVRDAGGFHYHLRKLRDHFVRKVEEEESDGEATEGSDGYVLTPAGFKIAQAVVAGTGIDAPVIEDLTLDDSCPRCEDDVELTYSGGAVRVYCTDCPGFWTGTDEYGAMGEGYLGGWEFPPAGLANRSPEQILDASILHMITRTEALMAGVCPDCGGPVEGTLHVCEDHDPDGGVCEACGRGFLGVIWWRCDVCKLGFGAPSWAAAVQHPTVRSLLAEEGIDYRDDPWRAVHVGYERGWAETAISTDPLRIRIDVAVGEETTELVLDGSGSVVEARR